MPTQIIAPARVEDVDEQRWKRRCELGRPRKQAPAARVIVGLQCVLLTHWQTKAQRQTQDAGVAYIMDVLRAMERQMSERDVRDLIVAPVWRQWWRGHAGTFPAGNVLRGDSASQPE